MLWVLSLFWCSAFYFIYLFIFLGIFGMGTVIRVNIWNNWVICLMRLCCLGQHGEVRKLGLGFSPQLDQNMEQQFFVGQTNLFLFLFLCFFHGGNFWASFCLAKACHYETCHIKYDWAICRLGLPTPRYPSLGFETGLGFLLICCFCWFWPSWCG